MMRLKTLVRCSASAAALTLASPALAQPDTTQPPVVTEEDDAAQDETAQTQPGQQEDVVVVTGLRQSLRSSQNIRRNSDQIVDAVVAEDIGKLPDRTVSEALARVPGVTVERQVAEAGDVFIRGLRDPATTYNGRDIFTAEVRNVAPQDFPAGGVAALEVFKSQTAEQLEGNLAGLINVRSRRPFDFPGLEIAGSLNGTYADLAQDFAWNGNLLVSNRWNVGDGELGILLNASYTELEYQDSVRFVSGDFFGINPDPARPGTFCDNFDAGCLGSPPPGNVPGVTVRVPVGVGLFQNAGQRWRPSANGTIEYRPDDRWRVYFEGLYQGFRRRVSDRQLFTPLFAGSGYTNVVIGQQGAEFDFPDSLNVTAPGRAEGFQAATREETNTYQFAVGTVYEDEVVRLSADIARTDTQFDLSIYSVDYAITSRPNVSVIFDSPEGRGGVDFTMDGLDLTNLANYRYRGLFDRHLTARGDDWQYRVDGTIKDVLPWIRAIDLGFRFSDRDAGFSNGERYNYQEPLNLPYGSLPLEFQTMDWQFRDDVLGINQLVLPTYASIREGISDLRAIAGFPDARPPENPLQSYEATEQATTGYAQVRWGFEGDITVDGVLGVRVVNTQFDLEGFIENRVAGGPAQILPLHVSNEYTDVLPNASIRVRVTPEIQIRAAYTQTRRRPDFGQLNPGLVIDPPGGGLVRTGRGGNPNLQPVLSDNYDLTFEYYFSRTGFAALSLFRRDVSGFIVNLLARQEVPNIGPVDVFGPANSGEGRLQGAEFQLRTFFDFGFLPDFLHAFGTELNVTYIDNALQAPPDFGPNADEIQFPDVSEWTYNIVGFYERGPITARVAYNYRSEYTQFFVPAGNGAFGGEFVDGVSRLDASISYQINDNFTIAADVSNILGDPFRNYRQIEPGVVFPRDVRFEERVYSLGARFRF